MRFIANGTVQLGTGCSDIEMASCSLVLCVQTLKWYREARYRVFKHEMVPCSLVQGVQTLKWDRAARYRVFKH